MIIRAAENRVFRRIHDGFIMGNEIVLGMDYSTGVEREDLAEYYEQILPPDAPQPPPMSGFLVAIPVYWGMLFPNDTFVINEFIIQLERIDGVLAVDIAYLSWTELQNELDKPVNEAVKRHMMPIWDYVSEQAQQGNFI
jgi:hypothetical protein